MQGKQNNEGGEGVSGGKKSPRWMSAGGMEQI